MPIDWSEDDAQNNQLLDENVPLPIPDPRTVEKRAQKFNYALGDNSPGVTQLSNQILGGLESTIRDNASRDEDFKNNEARQTIVRALVQAKGSNLTPGEFDTVMGLSAVDLRSDPGTILEKKFAEKYVSDALSVPGAQFEYYTTPAATTETDMTGHVVMRRDYYQHQSEQVKAEREARGWLSAAADVVGQMTPIVGSALSWYRREHALSQRPGVELLPGSSQAANIRYLYSLPFDLQKVEFEKAMTYLKSKNLFEAQDFADAMLAFSSSDEFVGNVLAIVDYTSVVGGLARKMVGQKALVPIEKRDPLAIVEEARRSVTGPMNGPWPKVYEDSKNVGPRRYQGGTELQMDAKALAVAKEKANQLDLFNEGNQPTLRGMNLPEQATPTLESKLGPGKLRATHVPPDQEPRYPTRNFITGRMERKPTQLEMDLPQGQQQFDLGLTGGGLRDRTTPPPVPPNIAPLQVRQALSDVIKAAETVVEDAPAALAQVGAIRPAAVSEAMKRVLNPFGVGNVDLSKEIPSLAVPGSFLNGSKTIARELAQDYVRKAKDQASGMMGAFSDAVRVPRTTQEALAKGVVKTEQDLAKEYGGRVRILNYEFIPAEAHPANVDTVVARIGKSDATLFKDTAEAEFYRKEVYKLGDNEAFVRIQGHGAEIIVPKHVNETDELSRAGMVVPKNSTPVSILNMMLNRIRTTADTLSRFQMENRITATHAPQEVYKAIRDVVKTHIEDTMSGKELQQLEDILRVNRDTTRPDNPSKRGVFYKNATEFETAFLERFKKLPTAAQTAGYDTFVRISDLDWLLRNVAVYRDKARQGIQSFRFQHGDIETPWFDGKKLDKMNWAQAKGEQDAGVYVYDQNTKTGRFYYKFDMPQEVHKEIDDMVNSGQFHAIQIYDPKTHPLKGIAQGKVDTINDQINYVITNTFEKGQLSWKQVDYEPGGHSIYKWEHYVAQPVIQEGRKGKWSYFGDNVALNVRSEAEARRWAKAMDTGRQLLRDAKMAELETHLRKNLGMYDLETFQNLFRRSDSPFSLDHEITVKRSGATTLDSTPSIKATYESKGGLIDTTKNSHDLSNWMDKSYLADRDLRINTVDEKTMKLMPAEQLDPYAALQKGMSQAVRNIWMNDYKIGAIESWIAEFGKIMDVSKQALHAYPTHFLYNPEWKENLADRATLAAGKASQRAIVSFIGQKSELGANLDHIGAKLQDSIYKTFGQKGVKALEKADEFVDDIGLATIKDPTQFMRAVAFHSKLGLFNPVNMLVQTQIMTHAIAVTGVQNGTAAVAAGVFARIAAHNPNMIDTLANAATKLGWKKVDFKEMYEAMRAHGIYQIGGTAALKADAMDPKLFKGAVTTFLDKGAFFFNESERLGRLTAYAAAYREWKLANPGKVIGNRELGEIGFRFDTLSGNMTRAAMAEWQQGIAAVPTQFFAFNARMMEQMLPGLSNRLTGAEKLRAFATYSTLYGVPATLGMYTMGASPIPGVPTSYEDIKKEAALRNIKISDTYLEGLANGVISLGIHYALGREYNFTGRAAPGASTSVSAILNEDKGWQEIALGASGSILGDMFKAMKPLYYYAASVFGDTGEYQLQASDWMSFFRNASTLDIAAKIHGVLSYGKWITKTGTVVGDADSMDAALTILGLTPQHLADTYLKQRAIKENEKTQESFAKDALDQFRRGIQAGAAGDTEAMAKHWRNAHTIMQAGDMTIGDVQNVMRRAATSNQDLENKVNWDLIRKAGQSRLKNFLGQ